MPIAQDFEGHPDCDDDDEVTAEYVYHECLLCHGGLVRDDGESALCPQCRGFGFVMQRVES